MVNGMVNLFKNTFKQTSQTVGYTFNRVKPPRSFSWQMLLLLSVFSWVLSLLAEANWLSHFLTNGAWLFLISGVNWALLENPVRIFGLNLGPWITGALVGLFLFGQGESIDLQIVLVLWPLISTAIAIFPYFLSKDLQLTVPNTKAQQQIVLLILINLTLSCWIQFYFNIQRWLTQYPSLLVSNFSASAFVLSLGDVDATPRGVSLLEQTEALIINEIDGKPWSYAERWLFQIDNNLPELRADALDRLLEAEEDHFWNLQEDVDSAGANYELNLRAIWTGPGTLDQPYALQETCEIRQTQSVTAPAAPGAVAGAIASGDNSNLSTAANNTPMTEVVCSEISEVPVEPAEPPAPAVAPTPSAPAAPTTAPMTPNRVPPDALMPTPPNSAPTPTAPGLNNAAPGASPSAVPPTTAPATAPTTAPATGPVNFGEPASTP
ncbi:MAG: DUF5357 family protein [Thainema sp.]